MTLPIESDVLRRFDGSTVFEYRTSIVLKITRRLKTGKSNSENKSFERVYRLREISPDPNGSATSIIAVSQYHVAQYGFVSEITVPRRDVSRIFCRELLRNRLDGIGALRDRSFFFADTRQKALAHARTRSHLVRTKGPGWFTDTQSASASNIFQMHRENPPVKSSAPGLWRPFVIRR